MNPFLSRLKSLWKAIIQPDRVYTTYTKTDHKVPQEVWDRVEKAFKQVDEAFKEVEQAIDSLKKK